MTARTDELPQMIDAAHSHTIYNPSAMHVPQAMGAVNLAQAPLVAQGIPFDGNIARNARQFEMQEVAARRIAEAALKPIPKPPGPQQGAAPMANTGLRFVQIFIADPDPMVPLADRLLHHTEQFLTDLTDAELFYDLPMRTLLETHNVKRGKLYNKANKERAEMLEPIRIRDLKMTVVTIASF